MCDAKGLFDKLVKNSAWGREKQKKLEHESLSLGEGQLSTDHLFHRDHPKFDGDSEQTWSSHGSLPYFFDVESLRSGIEELVSGMTDTCKVFFTLQGGNTDGGVVHRDLKGKNEGFEISRHKSGEFEIRIFHGRIMREPYLRKDKAE